MREQSGAWLRLSVTVDPGEIPHQWSHHRVSSRLQDSKLGGTPIKPARRQRDSAWRNPVDFKTPSTPKRQQGEIPHHHRVSSRLRDSKYIKPASRERVWRRLSLAVFYCWQQHLSCQDASQVLIRFVFKNVFARSSINMYWWQMSVSDFY